MIMLLLYVQYMVNLKLNKVGCKICGYKNRKGKKKISLETVLERFKKRHGDRYDYSKVKLGKRVSDKVEIICPIHGSFWQSPNKHASGRNCPKCSGKNRHSAEYWRELARKIRGDEYDYSKANYVNKTTRVTIICREHGEFEQLPGDHLYKNAGCPKCQMSKPEKIIHERLTKEGIEFKIEYKIPGYSYRYDFYLTKLNLLIEYNGLQHYNQVDFFHNSNEKYGLSYIQKLDKEKVELANTLGIPLIVIKFNACKIEDLSDYLMFRISKYYKYRVGNKWYRNLFELYKGENKPEDTKPSDVSEYLVYKK